MRTAYVLYLLMVMLMVTHAQVEKSIIATHDCGVYESANGSLSNGIGPFLCVGKIEADSGKNRRRALLKFDLENIIPLQAEILSVQLKIHVVIAPTTDVQRIDLFRITSDWGEGTSNDLDDLNLGQGAPSTNGDATWIHRFFDTVPWVTPGGDYIHESSSFIEIGSYGIYTFDPTTVLVNDIQGWVDNPATNFGWMLIGNEAVSKSVKAIDSRESYNEADRPTLIVQYKGTARVNTKEELPGKFLLEQNFPNPFNPTTVIRYSIPVTSHVVLKVFDVLGKEIAVLVDEIKDAGSFSNKWSAAGLPSGIYFYRLQSGNNVVTKKLALTK